MACRDLGTPLYRPEQRDGTSLIRCGIRLQVSSTAISIPKGERAKICEFKYLPGAANHNVMLPRSPQVTQLQYRARMGQVSSSRPQSINQLIALWRALQEEKGVAIE